MAGAIAHGAARARAVFNEQFPADESASDDHYSRGRGASRPPTEEEILDSDIQAAEQKLAELDSKIERQERHKDSLERNLPDMISRNAEVEKEINTVNQDLAATRAHAPEEGTMLKGEVIDGFLEVGKCITDITDTCMARCSSWVDRALSRRRAGQIRDYFRGKEPMKDSDKLVEFAEGGNLRLITEILLRRYLCIALEQFIFRPFLPGDTQDDEETRVLFDILYTSRHRESQDRRARWRALTYKHALSLKPRDEGWCVESATTLLNEISGLMAVINDSNLTEEGLQAAFELISRMFNTTAQFKDKAMMNCTEVDFMAHLRTGGEKLSPAFMQEVCRGRSVSRNVVLGVGLGLQLAHTVQKGSAYERHYEHPIAALVIGDKSAL